MVKLYIVRHCEAQGNTKRMFQGSMDCDITNIGAAQLECLGRRFADVKVDAVYSSPLLRARKTAQVIAEPKGLDVIIEPDLREIDGGVIEGLTFAEIFEHYRELEDAWNYAPQHFAPENGDSMRSVYTRISVATERIVRENYDRTIVITSHGGAIRNLLCYYLFGTIDRLNQVSWCDNTSVTLVEFNNDFKPEIVYINNTEHLPEHLLPVSSRIVPGIANTEDAVCG